MPPYSTTFAANRSLRPMFRLLFLLALPFCLTLGAAETTELRPIPLGSEPSIGEALRLGSNLDADADTLRKAHPELCRTFDDSLSALQKGDLILAAAIAHEAIDSGKTPEEQAPGHARLGLIHALAGSVHVANAHLEEVQSIPALRGEVHAARALLLWQLGCFSRAEEEITLAASSKPVAHDWLLKRWKNFYVPRYNEAAAFEALETPEPAEAPAGFAYLENALRLGATRRVDYQLALALNHLIQAKAANEEGAEAGLLRCRRLQRTLFTQLLRSQLRPEAQHTWGFLCECSLDATRNGGGKADWDLFLGAVLEGRKAIPGFDLTVFNFTDAFATAERAGAGKLLLDALRPASADPRVQYGSHLIRVLDGFDELPAAQVVHITDAPELSPDDQMDFQKTLAWLEDQEKTSASLRAALPKDAAEVSAEQAYRGLLARVRFMDAQLRGDAADARIQLNLLEAVAKVRNVWDLEACRSALAGLEEKNFPAQVLALAALPTDKLPGGRLTELVMKALSHESTLQKAHGRDVLSLPTLNGAELELQRSIVLLRLLSNCSSGSVDGAERLLARLQALCDPGHLPGFPALEGSVQRVAALPFSLRAIKDPEVVKFIDDLEQPALSKVQLAEYAEDLDLLGEELHVDELRLGMLETIHHFRSGEEWSARERLAQLRAEIPHNLAVRAELDRIEQTYTPASMIARAMEACRTAEPGRKEDRYLILSRLADRHYLALKTKFGPEALNAPAKLPAPERATFFQASLAQVMDAVDRRQLLDGLRWARPLAEDKDIAQQARTLLATLPLTLDLPDDAARQLWKDVPVLDKLPKEQLRVHLATLQRLHATSVYGRITEFLWLYKQANYDKAGAVLDELRPLFASHLKTQGATAMMALMLRNARDAKADTLSRMQYASQERLKYFNDYNSTVRQLNGEAQAGIDRDQRMIRQALDIQQAKDSGMISTQEALSQVERLQAGAAANDNNEYARRNRQRSLDFLEEAKQKIARYDQELQTLSANHNAAQAQQVATLHEYLAKLAE